MFGFFGGMTGKELVERVRDYGGRFLEKNDCNLWVEMNEKSRRKKASQGRISVFGNMPLS